MVRNLPLMCICLCNTLHLGDARRMTASPFNSLSVPRAEQRLISHCKRQFYGDRVTPWPSSNIPFTSGFSAINFECQKKKKKIIFHYFPTLRTTPWLTCGMRYCMASARNVNAQTQSRMWWVSKTWISGKPDLAGGKHSWIATKLLLPQNQNKAPEGSTDVNQLTNPVLQSSMSYQLEDKRVSARKPIHIRTFWLKAWQSGHHPNAPKLFFHQLLSFIRGQGSPGTSRGDRLSCSLLWRRSPWSDAATKTGSHARAFGSEATRKLVLTVQADRKQLIHDMDWRTLQK